MIRSNNNLIQLDHKVPKHVLESNNTSKTFDRLGRVDPIFDELLAKYTKIVPHNRPIKNKVKKRSVRKQRPTKSV
jgi:hypothetical protein